MLDWLKTLSEILRSVQKSTGAVLGLCVVSGGITLGNNYLPRLGFQFLAEPIPKAVAAVIFVFTLVLLVYIAVDDSNAKRRDRRANLEAQRRAEQVTEERIINCSWEEKRALKRFYDSGKAVFDFYQNQTNEEYQGAVSLAREGLLEDLGMLLISTMKMRRYKIPFATRKLIVKLQKELGFPPKTVS